jgi:hypothetical protein
LIQRTLKPEDDFLLAEFNAKVHGNAFLLKAEG